MVFWGCAAAFAGETDLKPVWLEDYRLSSGQGNTQNLNTSYLMNRNSRVVSDPLVDQFDGLIDSHQAQVWRQQYDDLNRDYENRKQAGLNNSNFEQAHEGAMSDFSNHVLDDIEKRKLQRAGDDAVHSVEKNEAAKTVMAPGVVAAGVYVGKPVNMKLTDDSKFSFRTSLRDRFGQIELHSPVLYGSFEYHPQAPDNYTLISSSNVDFGQAMDFNRVVDFQAEKYQLKVVKGIPMVDLNSSVQYASSSNVVAGSLTKRLTDHLVCVFDSIRYLTPIDDAHTLEERVRLRYDVHF